RSFFFKLFQAARCWPERLVSFLRSYRNWLPSPDSGYASRALRQAIHWSGDHDSDLHSLPPGPAAARSGEGAGHLDPALVAADKGRAYPLRPRWQRQAQNRLVPRGRPTSLADPASCRREGGRAMTPLESLLARLPGAKKAGNGWSARCPAHDD